jgi:exodeoxyribonuclease VII small subunit
MSEELDSASFNTNYQVLKETADWLSGQKEPDIDQLVPKVEAAMRAYRICKDRLDQVQATLGQYFREDGAVVEPVPSSNGNGRGQRPSQTGPMTDGESGRDAP